jgi:hypothetical protein
MKSGTVRVIWRAGRIGAQARADSDERGTPMRLRAIGIMATGAVMMVMTGACPGQAADDVKQLKSAIQALQQEVAALQSQLAALQANKVLAVGPYVSVVSDPINGVAGPHIIFTGANIHVRDGSGATVGSTGLGNLIVGYDEPPTHVKLKPQDRGGTHNLVVGSGHRFSYFGGFVAGHENMISGLYTTVTGGFRNVARGEFSTVSGGESNEAANYYTAVSGGGHNAATGYWSWVGGGQHNAALGGYSSVTGGQANSAAGGYSSVNGGFDNQGFGAFSSVTGGEKNHARAPYSSVSGGRKGETAENWQWVSGASQEKVSGAVPEKK